MDTNIRSKNSDIKDYLHLVLSPWDLTDDYNRHAGVTLFSSLKHCSQPTIVHLLYDADLSVGKEKEVSVNKAYFREIADFYDADINYHHVDIPAWVQDIPNVKKWTPGTLLRLALPDILPDVEKVIYLDCDMVVTTDLKELWDVDLKDYPLAACPDSSLSLFDWKRKKYYNKINLSYENYFCAGTLILNLKKIREMHVSFVTDVFQFFYKHQDLPYLDQDLLNFYFGDNYLKLDCKYNIYSSEQDSINRAGDGIIHYASSGKPWKCYIGEIDDYYWKYFMETPWCQTKHDVLIYSRMAPDISRCFTTIPSSLVIYSKGNIKKTLISICTMNINIFKELVRGLYFFVKIHVLKRGF